MAGDARVGPYRIFRLVNRGGQGSVYLGYDKRLQRRVAIKIYPLPADRKGRKSLLREAQLIASIDSPRVVKIHDVIESSDHMALVMEYVPGCDLEEFLASVRPSLASTLTVTAHIASALAAARHRQIVHGDLKAANVLIAADGRVKLTDFGISRERGSSRHRAGSLAALSPEHYRGLPLDERSDLFALGCLLYRMLAGVHPFMRKGELDSRMLLERSPPPVGTLADGSPVPRELEELLGQLLQQDPQKRPGSTRPVRQVLRRVSRLIPLAASDSLLAEARPCFRPESPEDVPPAVPPGLGRRGRSRLGAKAGSGRSLLGQPMRHWLAGGALIVALGGIVGWAALQPQETHVHIAAPEVRLANGVRLPEGLSRRWLVEQVSGALSSRLGALRVTGPIGATPVTTLHSASAMPGAAMPAAEQLRLGLRCEQLVCVFVAGRRSAAGERSNRQAVLFPDMPLQEWQEIVRETAAALYP